MTQFLRAEAQPLVQWDAMYATQQQAFRSIVQMLDEAVGKLPPADSNRANSREQEELLLLQRTTQLAFLSGSRGTGKTSVMASLRRICGARRDSIKLDGFPTDLTPLIANLQSHLIWLEPLDMELSSNSSNLLAAILARIEDAATSSVSGGRAGPAKTATGGLLDNEYRDPLLDFQRFQANMSIAWDTAWAERRPQLDPDSLATESMRFEKSRLSLALNLHRVLNNFAGSEIRLRQEVTNPLFVLPVDDFDLSPSSCLDLLRVLRTISVPRLFFLVLGDLRVAQIVLNLKFSSDLAGAAKDVRHPDTLAVRPDEVASTASEVAANALRKLIPPAQRVNLLHPTLREALSFRPIGHTANAPALWELLHKCPVFYQDHTDSDHSLIPNGNLLTQMLPRFQLEGGAAGITTDRLLGGPQLSPLSILLTSSRAISDLWYRLRRMTQRLPAENLELSQPEREAWGNALCEFAGQLCSESWSQDDRIPLKQRVDVPGAFENDGSGIWNLNSLPLNVDTTVTPGLRIRSHSKEVAGAGLEFELNRPGSWQLYVGDQHAVVGPGTSSRAELSPQTTGAVMLFHDLVVGGQQASSLLRRNAYWYRWAVTVWRRGNARVELSWPVAPSSRFWNPTWFANSWNPLLSRHTELLVHPSLGPAYALFQWIHVGTQSLDFDESSDLYDVSSERLPWSTLYKQLSRLIPGPDHQSDADRQARDWLISIGSMFMPEMGLSDLFQAKPTSELLDFWQSESSAIARMRAYRLAQFIAEDLKSSAEELRNAMPKYFQTNVFRPARHSIEAISKTLQTSSYVNVEIDVAENASGAARGKRRKAALKRGGGTKK